MRLSPGHNAAMTITERREDPERGEHARRTGDRRAPAVPMAVVTLVLAITGLLLSFTAMMALFLGADGPAVQSLLGLTGWLLLPAGALALLCLRLLPSDGRGALTACWSRLPAWLVLLIAMMLLLAVLAELAIWLVEFAGGGTVALGHYLPIMAVLIYSLALTAGYALVAPTGEGGEHRGPVRHTDPVARDPD
jgi:hypothetical protein